MEKVETKFGAVLVTTMDEFRAGKMMEVKGEDGEKFITYITVYTIDNLTEERVRKVEELRNEYISKLQTAETFKQLLENFYSDILFFSTSLEEVEEFMEKDGWDGHDPLSSTFVNRIGDYYFICNPYGEY